MSKKCEYCQLETKYDESKDFDIGFYNTSLEVGYMGNNESDRTFFEINYCPWCGRKLKEEKDE